MRVTHESGKIQTQTVYGDSLTQAERDRAKALALRREARHESSAVAGKFLGLSAGGVLDVERCKARPINGAEARIDAYLQEPLPPPKPKRTRKPRPILAVLPFPATSSALDETVKDLAARVASLERDLAPLRGVPPGVSAA
jgi:hypothetical protein